jgi:tRNA(Ile2) C34 agmatinyltransferase TiaS
MTPHCPACCEPMKKQGRAFKCAPCREIIIFFRVTDASPYTALAVVDRVAKPMKPLREPTINFESNL